jgi:membrane-associated phospholipid phosphatase
MTILFLSAINNKMKWVLFALGLIVIYCIIAQHVHYIIDILAAIPFSYLAWRLALMLNARLHGWDFIYRQK